MARRRDPLPIPQLECPLGEEHCALLNQALQSCNDLQCYLEKLQSLGLDVSEWLAQSRSNEALAQGLKQIHFPNHA